MKKKAVNKKPSPIQQQQQMPVPNFNIAQQRMSNISADMNNMNMNNNVNLNMQQTPNINLVQQKPMMQRNVRGGMYGSRPTNNEELDKQIYNDDQELIEKVK